MCLSDSQSALRLGLGGASFQVNPGTGRATSDANAGTASDANAGTAAEVPGAGRLLSCPAAVDGTFPES